jgi:hypothetical protein
MSAPSPADVAGVLSGGFQNLYNAAWGRGTRPLVDANLANAIADAWDHWRSERNGAALLPERVERYRALFEALRKRMATAGKPIPALKDMGAAFTPLADFGREIAKGVAVGGILYLLSRWATRREGE